jgi:hypothetical protein
MSDLAAREAAAREALSRRGLTLAVCYSQRRRGEYFAITANPDPNTETTTNLPTMEMVEDYIFELTRREQSAADPADAAAPLKPIESQPYIGAPVHYVSYGTPGGEYGRECRAAWVTELTEVEVNEQNPAGDGIFRQTAGLFVANPNGAFHNRGVLYVPGTFRGPAREAAPGEPLPIITCADMEFAGGTWHWPAHS